jgi:putative phosphoribosyl transferase
MELKNVSVEVELKQVVLEGDLAIPEDSTGIVVFAHGSGSSRHSPRNRQVAHLLNKSGLATLLIDLLTREEEAIDSYHAVLRFDIPMLADRLIEIVNWVGRQPLTQSLQIGLFGSSTGGGAALVAAAKAPQLIKAVVSRGGRPDLAKNEMLQAVKAPVLLIVGSCDTVVLDLNRQAQAQLRAENALRIVENATHLFQEPGALETVARLAAQWFKKYL